MGAAHNTAPPLLFPPPPMASFNRFGTGCLNAFNDEGEMLMSMNVPTVSMFIDIADAKRWITTLEEAAFETKSFIMRQQIYCIVAFFKAAIDTHQKQHQQLLEQAPTIEDLQEYLRHYNDAMKDY